MIKLSPVFGLLSVNLYKPLGKIMHRVDPRIDSTPLEPITSVSEFASRYSVNIDQGIIQIVDRTTDLVLATLATPPEEAQGKSYYPPHFYEGNYYFVLSSQSHTTRYIYNYNLQNRSIECKFGPLHHPYFFESRLIEFATGFKIPGPQKDNPFFKTGKGVIKIYDLTQRPFFQLMNLINVEDGGGCGWDGEIDKEKREITAYCHVKGITRRFPFFDKV
jgi:hypothetical protein